MEDCVKNFKSLHRLALCLAVVTLSIANCHSAPAQSAASPMQKPPSPAASPPKSASAPKIPIPDIPYTKFVLDNGLTLLVHEDHKAPIVPINTWYHVRAKNEKPGKTGFAPPFEHLMFSGSENFNLPYINAMESIGATDLNGTTNNDRTNYFENAPPSRLNSR